MFVLLTILSIKKNNKIHVCGRWLIWNSFIFEYYTFEELKWHACHFILSKWQSFTDLYEALRADSNLQWSKCLIFQRVF